MNAKELSRACEAVLFAGDEPVETEKLCRIFETEPKNIEDAMKCLSDRLDEKESGLMLLCLDGAYQMVTRKEYAPYITAAYNLRRRTPLSQAALEVLAVVAYNQPVTRAFVEQVRGVDCSAVITNLMEKDLIEERGRLELPGRPLLYGTTKNFLRCFCISDLSELPELPQKETTGTPDLGEQLSVEPENEKEAAD